MQGAEMKALRTSTGMSQAELADAIGMSRESIGSMERGTMPIERRTELAIRYTAGQGRAPRRGLDDIHHHVADLLDHAAVRGKPSIDDQRELRAAIADWNALGGGEMGKHLLAGVESAFGSLHVFPEGDPVHASTLRGIAGLKAAWSLAAQPS